MMNLEEHDHETPHCAICAERIGMHNDTVLMLKGQFFYDTENGCAMFILDPDTQLVFAELPDALGPGKPQFAIVINADAPAPIVPLHESCAEDELQMSDDDESDTEDTEDGDDDPDDLDAQMRSAIERDIYWDKNDLLQTKRMR